MRFFARSFLMCSYVSLVAPGACRFLWVEVWPVAASTSSIGVRWVEVWLEAASTSSSGVCRVVAWRSVVSSLLALSYCSSTVVLGCVAVALSWLLEFKVISVDLPSPRRSSSFVCCLFEPPVRRMLSCHSASLARRLSAVFRSGGRRSGWRSGGGPHPLRSPRPALDCLWRHC